MPKKLGPRYIKDEAERSTTFNKLCDELIKHATDLSVLTGARTAVVLESETGKVHSFGTPSADSIMDSFLSGNPCLDLPDEQNANIMWLQKELAQLERAAAKEQKRAKALKARTKQIQESSSMSKFIFSKVEELNAEDLIKLGRELSRLQLVQPGSSSGGQSDGYGPSTSGY